VTHPPSPARRERGLAVSLASLWIWCRLLPAILVLGGLFILLRMLFVPRRRLDRALKWGLRFHLKLVGLPLSIEGLERIESGRHYTVMFNHLSALDHLLVYGWLRMFGKGLEAEANFRVPFYGWLARAAGNVRVDRRRPKKARKALVECARLARDEGFSIYCAPEGTRSRDGFLGPFKSGVFRMAIECGHDVLPVALFGLGEVLPRRSWRFHRRPVALRVLEPIRARNAAGQPVEIDALKAQVREALVAAGVKEREN
jgi:1-acyl-sn-glycerol-3-phosphate acyltransferase